MMTIEIKVNGTVISQTYIHNISPRGHTDNTCDYEWHTYFIGNGNNPKLFQGTHVHKRDKGALVIARDILTKVIGRSK